MDAASPLYTPAVAAVLSGVALKTVRSAVGKRIIDPGERPAGRRASRSFSATDVLRLKLWHDTGTILSHEHRRRLFHEIECRPDATRVRIDTLVLVDVGEARKQIARRARALEAAEALVTSSPAILGGEPVFLGTRIPVRAIASMLDDDVDEREILDGYPKLKREHLALARIWSAAHPRRSRPKTSADRAPTETSRIRLPLGGDPGPQTSRVSHRS